MRRYEIQNLIQERANGRMASKHVAGIKNPILDSLVAEISIVRHVHIITIQTEKRTKNAQNQKKQAIQLPPRDLPQLQSTNNITSKLKDKNLGQLQELDQADNTADSLNHTDTNSDRESPLRTPGKLEIPSVNTSSNSSLQ